MNEKFLLVCGEAMIQITEAFKWMFLRADLFWSVCRNAVVWPNSRLLYFHKKISSFSIHYVFKRDIRRSDVFMWHVSFRLSCVLAMIIISLQKGCCMWVRRSGSGGSLLEQWSIMFSLCKFISVPMLPTSKRRLHINTLAHTHTHTVSISRTTGCSK